MTFKGYKNLLKDEWEFHKRNPEMFFVWGAILISWIYLLVKWIAE
jgi:hypothetical protein